MRLSTIYSQPSTALRLRRQWTCRELNPEALIASQSADPSASPFVTSMTRVGVEPDLAGLKDQRPHQKSNEPQSVMYVRTSSAVVLRCVFASCAFSGLGGARTLLCGSSDRR